MIRLLGNLRQQEQTAETWRIKPGSVATQATTVTTRPLFGYEWSDKVLTGCDASVRIVTVKATQEHFHEEVR